MTRLEQTRANSSIIDTETDTNIPKKSKFSKLLLPHENALIEAGSLENVTHKGSSSIWLNRPSSTAPKGQTNVYRVMGDLELVHLLTHNALPNSQPYQAIMEGDAGRAYAEKFLTGKKWVSTSPTTVVEFSAPVELIKTLFDIQHKAEDGTISMGLGDKAGGGLHLFNQSIFEGLTTWRIVKVKRSMEKLKSRFK